MPNGNSAAELKLAAGFKSIQALLQDDKFQDRWEKPLAYWTLPNDRRLPVALLDRSLAEILRSSFEQLASTPGIGEKKIQTLVVLLHRASLEHMPHSEMDFALQRDSSPSAASCIDSEGRFDATVVSESMWAEWCNTVARHGLVHEHLGRLTPSLQEMPTVIWKTPLGNYLGVGLSQMRNLKTHGEKRVRLVLEVFHIVHRLLAGSSGCEHLELRLIPQFVHPIEAWIREAVQDDRPVSLDEVRRNVILPLLEQIKVDAGHTVFLLARDRLGVNGEAISVRSQSRQMGVTRARVYQLLDDCVKIMDVRWPEGKLLFAELERKLERQPLSEDEMILFDGMRDLFYPKPNVRLTAPSFA